MTNDEIENLVKQTSDLIEYQSSVDTIENLRKLPALDVSDIDLDVNKLNTKVLKEGNVTNIIHEFNTNGIGYLNVYFDLKSLTEDEFNYAAVLPSLLIALDTKNYKASELQNFIKHI